MSVEKLNSSLEYFSITRFNFNEAERRNCEVLLRIYISFNILNIYNFLIMAKHVFFMLDACKTNEDARGFYNEFLKDELTPHRKVFEILSSRTKANPTVNQLSGLGFNTTTRNDVVVRVKGKTHRTFKVVF